MAIIVGLDVQLAQRDLPVGGFADTVGITPAHIAVLRWVPDEDAADGHTWRRATLHGRLPAGGWL
ncbi:transcriptional regulator [Streptomyces chrestomyceticus JCM 4735]|uniref:Transcriptional regulator n=1 Tax=Streptomyces chrestomyceticus JCM 4735 TaxID=1306181 RepID=A0A7U9Q2Z8_9ACTN|nr:hypothetical protein [Streptomyces chrestomyceticus]GCD40000.1 transcriptional regulator [Streptomyces chrestomyceticus JCM 4735]